MYDLDAINARVNITRNTDSWVLASGRWSCLISATGDGVKIEVIELGATFEEAVDKARNKLFRALDRGIPRNALAAPIEHKVLDDDIPF